MLGVKVDGFLLLLTSYVTRDKLPNLSELEFSHVKINSFNFMI